MLYRKQTRTIKNSTETTLETSTISSSALSFVLTTSDAFYVGYHRRFCSRYFNLSTLNSNACTLTLQTWDGSDWVAVEDKIDQTLGFTQSGFISWQNAGGWTESTQSPVTDVELFWLKITVSANLSAGTALQSVQNLFCDNTLLRAFYPELVSDSRYLPPDRTNFLEQFEAAKNEVVLRCKQLKYIHDEADIIDVSEVASAAAHKAAEIILRPIAGEEDQRFIRAQKEFEDLLRNTTFSFDLDESGTLTENEEDRVLPRFIPRR